MEKYFPDKWKDGTPGEVSGRLEFTESGVSMRAVDAQFLGGPVTLAIANQRDGSISLNARGTLNAAVLQSALEQPLLRQVSGTTSWNSATNWDPNRRPWSPPTPIRTWRSWAAACAPA